MLWNSKGYAVLVEHIEEVLFTSFWLQIIQFRNTFIDILKFRVLKS